MTESPPKGGNPPSAEPLLRAARPPVTRYRRHVVGAVIAIVGLIVFVALVFGFNSGRQGSRKADETKTADARAAVSSGPDFHGLASSYSDLGPSRLLADAAQALSLNPKSGPTTLTPLTKTTRETSKLMDDVLSAAPFFGTGPQGQSREADSQQDRISNAGAQGVVATQSPSSDEAMSGEAGSNTGSEKLAFLGRSTSFADTVAAKYENPTSPYEVKAGEIITGALLTAINSDLPGLIIAQVTQNVFDYATGEHVLIPQGARLLGRYDSQLTYGQSRALIIWNRIVMPNGRSINIGGMTGSDLTGASGLADSVDSHIGPITRAIALSTAIVVGGAIAQNVSTRSSENLIVNDAAGGVSAHASEVGERFIDKDLNRQPTIKIRVGWPLTVLVSKDISLNPY